MFSSSAITVPEELLEQFERGNVLLFIGEGVNAGVLPTSAELASELARRCDYPPDEPLTFPRVAGYYELTRHTRQGIVQLLRDRLILQMPQTDMHRLILQLRPRVIVSACYDRLLEDALRGAGMPYTSVVGNTDIPFADDPRVLLIWLWGTLEQPESLVLTEDDRRRFTEKQPNLSDVLRGELARRTLLFLGFDLADDWLRGFYDNVIRSLDRQSRQPYLVGPTLSGYARAWWEQRGAELIDAGIEKFLTLLNARLMARARPHPDAPLSIEPLSAALPMLPYKLLNYYEAGDAAIFCGRRAETRTLSALIHAQRLTILYGASGVGKTSLLLAGALPRLEHADPPYVTIYTRALEDPAQAIRRTLRRQMPDLALPNEGTLAEFLAAASRAFNRPLVIVLDQFEEFFIRLSAQFRNAFIDELAALAEARDVPVKVVLSLREDWLAAMGELEQRIPEVFRNRMRLLPLTREQAYQAVTAPVEQLGVYYEPTLVERLLDDLAGSAGTDVLPPQLQLVCSALYGDLDPGERLIALRTYERLGGTRGVLQQYMEDALTSLNHDERALARSVLAELITSQGTKAVKTTDELALALDIAAAAVAPVLEKLVRARLLRAVERAGDEGAYELAHEYLIREIELGADAQARKQAEELIRQEVDNWRRFGTLLAADKLALINEVQTVLRLSPEAHELLLRSALEVGDEIEYWLQRMSDPEQRARVLADKARTRLPAVRRRTAEVLGTQDVPLSITPLLDLTFHDPDPPVRNTARSSLAKLSAQHSILVERLQAPVESHDRVERRIAYEILAGLPIRTLPRRLRLPIAATRLRMRTTALVGASVATPIRRAVAVTAGLMLLLMAFAYLISANSYYISTQASPIQGAAVPVLVVRQGHPLLKLPGVNGERWNTGISLSSASNDGQDAISKEQLTDIWFRTTDSGYRVWMRDLLQALRASQRAPLLWDLGSRDETYRYLLLAARTTDESGELVALAREIGEVASIRPDLATADAVATLSLLTENKSELVRSSATAALGYVIAADPARATPETLASLQKLLDDPTEEVRNAAAAAIASALTTNPALANHDLIITLRKLVWAGGFRTLYEKDLSTALASVVVSNRRFAEDELRLQAAALDYDASQSRDASYAAPFVIGRTVAISSTLAPLMFGQLAAYLEKGQTRSIQSERLSEALGEMIAVNPRLATRDLTELLLVLGAQDDFNDRATTALRVAMTVNPALATPDIVAAFQARLRSKLEDTSNGYLEGELFDMLRAAVAANPALATPEVAASLRAALDACQRNTNITCDSNAAYSRLVAAIGQIGAANPSLTEEMVGLVRELLNNPNREVRAAAAQALGAIGAARLALSHAAIITLLETLRHQASFESEATSYALRDVVTAHPALISGTLQVDLEQLLSKNRSGDAIEETLAEVYTSQALPPGATDAPLFAMLADAHQPLRRPVAARALFLLALRDARRAQTIRERLEQPEYAGSDEPMIRVWANRTLAMIQLAEQSHAALTDPGRQQRLRVQLRPFVPQRDTNLAYDFTTRETYTSTFFDQTFAWAASKSLAWLKQQIPIAQPADLSRDTATLIAALGRRSARKGELDRAEAELRRAIANYSNIDLDPATPTRDRDPLAVVYRVGRSALRDQIAQLARDNQFGAALELLLRAEQHDPELVISVEDWYVLCLRGGLAGQAAGVMSACDRAVALAPEAGQSHESRGLARALTGDLKGALQDFEFVVAWAERQGFTGPDLERRKQWVAALRDGRNPIDAATLRALSGQ